MLTEVEKAIKPQFGVDNPPAPIASVHMMPPATGERMPSFHEVELGKVHGEMHTMWTRIGALEAKIADLEAKIMAW